MHTDDADRRCNTHPASPSTLHQPSSAKPDTQTKITRYVLIQPKRINTTTSVNRIEVDQPRCSTPIAPLVGSCGSGAKNTSLPTSEGAEARPDVEQTRMPEPTNIPSTSEKPNTSSASYSRSSRRKRRRRNTKD